MKFCYWSHPVPSCALCRLLRQNKTLKHQIETEEFLLHHIYGYRKRKNRTYLALLSESNRVAVFVVRMRQNFCQNMYIYHVLGQDDS